MRTYYERVCIFNSFALHVPHYRRKEIEHITDLTISDKTFIEYSAIQSLRPLVYLHRTHSL